MERGHVFKILVTGPYAAGKTSLIQSVSQTPVVSTDVTTSGDEAAVKAATTVAMDFGTFSLRRHEQRQAGPVGAAAGPADDDPADDVRLLLFGTPGQERFWFMTDVLKGEVDVVIFVVDAEARHTHAEAGAAMRALLRDLHVPLVVAVNRCDHPEPARLLARSLGALARETVVPCQLIDPASGRNVVIETLSTLLASLDAPGGHRASASISTSSPWSTRSTRPSGPETGTGPQPDPRDTPAGGPVAGDLGTPMWGHR